MATSYDDFWGRLKGATPGLFDLGVGAYGMNAGQKEAANRLRAAQGPLYNQQMGLASGMLAQAGNFDPTAAAKTRFDQAQSLLAPGDAKDQAALQRMLYARGQGGAASYTGVDAGGAPVNPQMAAYLQQKNRRDAQMAYDSLDQGDRALNGMLNRANSMQQGAANTQQAGLQAQGTQPSRAAANMNLLKGAAGVLGKAGAFKPLEGMFGKGVDWAKGLFGGGVPALPALRLDEGAYDYWGF